MRFPIKASDSYFSSSKEKAQLVATLLQRGTYRVFGYSPVRLLRPGLFCQAVEELGLPQPRLVQGDGIPVKMFELYKRAIYMIDTAMWTKLIPIIRRPELLFEDGFENTVVNAGLDDVLEVYFKGSGFTAANYVGLTDGTPTVAAADTFASHAGWTEVTAYSEAVRQTFTAGTVSSQSVDNSASKAEFSINGSATVGGACVGDNNTKGGSTGTLYSAGAFTGGDKSLGSGDTLSVQATFTSAAA